MLKSGLMEGKKNPDKRGYCSSLILNGENTYENDHQSLAPGGKMLPSVFPAGRLQFIRFPIVQGFQQRCRLLIQSGDRG